MSIINKIEHIFSTVLTTLAMTAALTGCADELMCESAEIPDTDVEIRGEVMYKPLVQTKVQTRANAPGGAEYKGIKSLYVFFFDSEKKIVEEYSGDIKDFTSASSESATLERVIFKKKVKAGQYYVYAVANIPDDKKSELEKVANVDSLRKFKLSWDDDIKKDLEMFGVFKQVGKQDGKEDSPTSGNEDFEADELVTITPDNNSLLSWARRAVSKVTVDFNGDKLKDGVMVYIKNAVLKNLPSGAFLGAPSRIDSDIFNIAVNAADTIVYGTGDSHEMWPKVEKGQTFSPKEIWQDSGIEKFHDENAKALPCYENLQGEPEGKSKLQDRNGDGIIDSEVCDGVENGTYLEVEGYYVAKRPEYKSEGKIIYRFMLGQNAVNNFDLIRNHHYKVTMNFKGYGNDVDWHIEYAEKYLDVSYPEDVNYRGKFFTPDADYNIPNGGHAFSEKNIITVTSFGTDGKKNTWIEPKQIECAYYKYENGNWVADKSVNWLTMTESELSEDNMRKQYTFVASKTDSIIINMNELLSKQPAVNGSKESPYNLSGENGGMAIKNTANCYIVGAPGWYCFPLVYGNAITGGGTNSAAYASKNIVNHLNNNITSPFIKDNGVNLNADNVSVEIIWRDDENIIRRTTDGGTLEYDEKLFNGKGGIKFYIEPGDITECNAVIALIDKNAKEDEFVKYFRDYWPYKWLHQWHNDENYREMGSTKAIWSWHIWVTRFGFEEFGKDIPVVNHEGKKFDVMPVNLGWCSGGREFRYYKPRKCEITFKIEDQEIKRTIIQYPHLLLPRGNHPYYQWGRKDPFVGTNKLWENKYRWSTIVDGSDFYYRDSTSSASRPTFLYYNEPDSDFVGNDGRNDRRKNTKDCLDVLVKNPDKWHDCWHGTTTTDPGASLNYFTLNDSPDDLWLCNGYKTVYDPCPPGYEVGRRAFTGFTTDGEDQETPEKWNDVLESNMEQDYYDYDKGTEKKPHPINSYVIELYTDTRKLQSIAFPITGYRDWDAWAEIIHFPPTVEQLGKDPKLASRGFVWTSEAMDKTTSFYLALERQDMIENNWRERGGNGDGFMWINPRGGAPNTDGMAVRPVAIESMKKILNK